MPNEKLQKEIDLMWNMKPKQAIDYFRQKQAKAVLTKEQSKKRPNDVFGHWDWSDTLREQHDRAFVVSKATSISLVTDIKKAIQKSIDEGTSYQDFANEIIPTLKKKGWWGKTEVTNPETGEVKQIVVDQQRLKFIYGTNMKTAYDAGKYKEMMDDADIAPYWRFVAIPKGPLNNNPRPEHAALHNMVLRYDDPFWKIFFGHKGWNCHCSTKSYTKRGIEQLFGKPAEEVVQKSKPENFISKTETIQGKQITTRGYRVGSKEVYPDAGWDYAPGSYSYRYRQNLNDTIKRIEDKTARNALTQQQQEDIKKNFKEMVRTDAPIDVVDKKGNYVAVGFLDSAQEEFCKKTFGKIDSTIMTFDQWRIRHTRRPSTRTENKKGHIGITMETLENVPELIEKYTPMFRTDDPEVGGLIFFSEPFEYEGKMCRNKLVFNIDKKYNTMTYVTGLIVDENDINRHTRIKK